MHEIDRLDTYVVRYSGQRIPGNERLRGPFLWVNCQAWGHRVLRERFGVTIPEAMLSLELYQDEDQCVRSVHLGEEMIQPGDIFLFGSEGLTDMRLLHWAIFTGFSKANTGEPILEHATMSERTVAFWDLSQFSNEPRYTVLYAVKRPLVLCPSPATY